MLSKDRVLAELNGLTAGATDYEKWAITRATRSVQAAVSERGVPGALWNALCIPEVLPKLSVSLRQQVLRLINELSDGSEEHEEQGTGKRGAKRRRHAGRLS